MAEPEKQLPAGAFVPTHGRGWLKPAKRFQPGNKAGAGNRNSFAFAKPRAAQAAHALKMLFPALAEAIGAPALTYRSWWRKRQRKAVIDANGKADVAEREIIGLAILRTPADLPAANLTACPQCGLALQGEALPLFAGGTVSGWVHPHCLLPASRIQLQRVRDALAKALEPWK